MKLKGLIIPFAAMFLILGIASGLLMLNTTAGVAAAYDDKIEPQLMDEFNLEGNTDFVVIFAEQADLTPAYTLDWNVRGDFVYNTLREVAERSQADAISSLEASGLRYQTFIAGNELYVFSGDLTSARDLASLPEVDFIRATRTGYLNPIESVDTLFDLVNWAGDYLANDLNYDVEMNVESSPAALAWGIIDAKGDQFWSAFTVQGDGIIVANIDTGVQWDHPALDQTFKCGTDPTDPDCWEDPSNICGGSMCDNNGHGTHTMGTMVADDDPSLTWQAGMAPNAQWIACKGCETNSCSDFALNACADWILAPGGDPANRPHIVNNSWGGGDGPTCDTWYLSKVNAWRAAGVYPAFSAGNSQSCATLGDPGSYQESFTTTGHNSSRGHYGSMGPIGGDCDPHEPYTKPNISSPAVSVCSTVPTDGWSCGYTGTSMASPHSAGAVALLWSCNPSLIGQMDMTFEALQNTADVPPAGSCGAPPDGEGNYTSGYGFLNAYEAGLLYCGSVDTGWLDGYVFDADTLDPIEGVSVVASASPLSGNYIDAVTDPSGYYTMTLVVGTYDVTASKYGYETGVINDVEILIDQVTSEDFYLNYLGGWELGPDPMCFDFTRFDAEFFPGTNKVYVLGGRVGADTYGDIYEFDPVTEACVDTGTDMPVPISNYTVNLVNDGANDVLCTFGGRPSAGGTTDEVQCYDPVANTAAVVSNLPSAYTGYAPGGQAVVDNMVYVFGGFNPVTPPYELARTDRYDPVANTFTQVGDLTLARSYLDVAVIDGAIYAFGGTTFDGTNLNAQMIAEVMADPGGAGTWDDAAVTDLTVPSAEGRAWGYDSNSGYPYANGAVIAGGGQWPGETAEALFYDATTDSYDYTFLDLNHARRDHAGVFVPICTEDLTDGLPGMWVFGGRQGVDDPPYMPSEYYPFAYSCEADVFVDPASLWATVYEGMTDVLGLEISDVGLGQLDWQLFEMGPPLLGGTYEPMQIPEGPTPEIDVATSAQADEPKSVPAAANPLAVLWDQYANWNSSDYAAQDFEPAYDIYDIYAGDDFENTEGWLVDTIVTRGGWGAFVDLSNASAIHWYIYADDGGVPAGVPGDGTEYWSLSLPPSDPQVGLGVYEPEDVELTLGAPIVLPPGNWWLVHFSSLEFGLYGQWGWSGTSDPVWGSPGQQNNPGGGFGLPPGWSPNSASADYMYRLEGEPFADVPWLSEDPISGTLSAGQSQVVDVTFDAGGMTPGDYYASLLVLSNDPSDPMVSVPVTMTVLEIVYDVELDPPIDPGPGDPGTVVTYTLSVTNTGNYTDTIDVGYSDNIWDVNLPETSFVLGSGEGTTFDVGVTVPAGAMGGDSDTVTITAIAGDGSTTDSIELTTTVSMLYGVILMPDSYSYPGDPGFYAQYMVAMTNTGNVEDTFDITYTGNDPAWIVEIPDTQFTIPAGGAVGVTVRVWVPLDALAGESDMVTVTSTSQGDGAVSDSVDLTTVAAEIFDAELTPDTAAMLGAPGETVEYDLTLTNSGNIIETFDVTFAGNDPAWVVVLPQTHFPDVGVGESVNVTVQVTVPGDAADGEFDMVDISVVSTSDGTTKDTSTLTTTASEGEYDVFLPIVSQAGSPE
jgi:hypothetical protein